MNMNPNMMMGGGMNPMMQMLMSMMQNQGGGQQMPYMRGGSMDCDEFEECLEKYCREVANGRRELPRAFKKMLKKAWQGAKQAVSSSRFDGDDDDDDEEGYSGSRHGKRHHGYKDSEAGEGFWNKIGKLHERKGNVVQLNDEMMRCFPDATPEEQHLLRKLALDYDEQARKSLTKLMRYGN